jgi:hypothetical protein
MNGPYDAWPWAGMKVALKLRVRGGLWEGRGMRDGDDYLYKIHLLHGKVWNDGNNVIASNEFYFFWRKLPL